MTKRIYNMRPEKFGRNGNIWAAHMAGANQTQIADAFDISVQRVSQILDQVRKAIPADEKATIRTMRLELLNELKAQMMDIALQPGRKAFAPNGIELPILDHTENLQAVDRLLKIDERIAKATGTDSAVDHNVTVTAEAVEATKTDADKAVQRFTHLIPMSPEVAAHASRG